MKSSSCAILALCLSTFAWGGDADRDGKVILSAHTAVPVGALNRDVNGQLGFGLGLGFQQPLTDRTALRGTFSWTGYRVNDRNLGGRVLASLFDASYSEDRLVLRSYAVGLDFVGYSASGGFGPYMLAGAGIQRARLYAEERYVDDEGNETIQDLGKWPAANTPYFNVGVGFQGRAGFFTEGKAVYWRYRAVEGYPLLDSPFGGTALLRNALSFTLSVGARF